MSRGVIVWEYMGDIPGLYAPYSDKVSNYIEEQYNKNPLCTIELKNIDPILKSYDVDLTAKKQIHKASKFSLYLYRIFSIIIICCINYHM